jgi:hypothetical protein
VRTQAGIAEVKRGKVIEANFARYLTEQRRKRMKACVVERIAKVQGRRGEDREPTQTAFADAQTERRGKVADRFLPLIDEREGAAVWLGEVLGQELGDVESHLIADILAGLLEL